MGQGGGQCLVDKRAEDQQSMQLRVVVHFWQEHLWVYLAVARKMVPASEGNGILLNNFAQLKAATVLIEPLQLSQAEVAVELEEGSGSQSAVAGADVSQSAVIEKIDFNMDNPCESSSCEACRRGVTQLHVSQKLEFVAEQEKKDAEKPSRKRGRAWINSDMKANDDFCGHAQCGSSRCIAWVAMPRRKIENEAGKRRTDGGSTLNRRCQSTAP